MKYKRGDILEINHLGVKYIVLTKEFNPTRLLSQIEGFVLHASLTSFHYLRKTKFSLGFITKIRKLNE